MSIFDRYLTRQFIRIFVMTFVSLLGVFVIGEFVTNFSEFMEYRDSTENFGQAMAAYYGARFPMFFDLAGHIIALLAAVLAISWMQRSNEMTAMQAAGISRMRIVRPLIIAALAVAALGALNREFVIPRVRHLLVNDVRDIVSERAEQLTPHYDNSTDILFDGDSILAQTNQITKPQLRLPFTWNSVGDSLQADLATYRESDGDLPAGYLMERTQPSLENATSLWTADRRPIILVATDNEWLKPDQCYVVSNLEPQELRGNHRWTQYASTSQLISTIRDPSSYHSTSTEITLHSRFVRPLLDMALLLFGLPVALANQSRRVVSGAAKSLGVVAIFALVTVGCQALGTQALVTPAMSAWLPLLILGPAAVLFSWQLSA